MNRSLESLVSLSWQSIAYGFGIFGRQLVVYLMLPIITNLVSLDAFGSVSILTSFYTVINTVTNVGLPAATFRFYNDEIDEGTKKTVLGTSQALFLIVALAFGIVIVIFSKGISSLLLGTTVYSLPVMIVALLLLIETMNIYGVILLRLQIRPGAVGVHSFVTVFSQMGLAILFIQSFTDPVVGYWLGFLLGALVGLGLMIFLNRKAIVFQFSRPMAKTLLEYGIPLLPANFSISFLQLTDRYFLRTYVDIESVAVYAIGYKIGSIVNLALAPFSAAWPNFAFSSTSNPYAKKIYRDVTTLLILGCIFVSLGTFLFRGELIRLLSPDTYQGAETIVPWISGAMIFNGIYPLMSLGPKIKKNTRPLAWLSFATAGLNIIFLLFLVPSLGMIGTAISVLLSYAFLSISNYIISRKFYSFQIDWRRIILIIIIGVGLALLGNILGNVLESLFWIYFVRVMVLMIFPSVLVLIRVIPKESFRYLTSLVTSRSGREVRS